MLDKPAGKVLKKEKAMAEPIEFATTTEQYGFQPIYLYPALANRHGCITGATGTGKTVTLQKLAESFSQIGVPVFLSDIKGDLSGISKAASPTEKVQKRLTSKHLKEPVWEANPVTFWDVFGKDGHPVRATISDMGPLLLAQLLELNDTQTGVLNAVFKIADDNGLLLIDMKDLRAMVNFVGENAGQFRTQYGNISSASIGAIQRGLLQLESQGGDKFFGEPMLDIHDLIQTVHGKGVINILAADQLMNSPKLYSCFLLWILSELFEHLPEVGDLEKPKLVFFFDEAHLLFNNAPESLMTKIEQVVRLIRSKGVGVYFVTQSPIDIPEKVLGQLGNRVQHALRAFTPRDQKAVKTVAQTMRPNPKLNIENAIMELGVGEALVSMLQENGAPGITERCWIGCPGSQIGPITAQERAQLMSQSLVAGVYEKAVDRISAYEKLTQQGGKAPAQEEQEDVGLPSGPGKKTAQREVSSQEEDDGLSGMLKDILFGTTGPRGGHKPGVLENITKTAMKTAGDKIVRGILGSILGRK